MYLGDVKDDSYSDYSYWSGSVWISHDLRERTRSIKVGSRQRKDRIVSHITDVLA